MALPLLQQLLAPLRLTQILLQALPAIIVFSRVLEAERRGGIPRRLRGDHDLAAVGLPDHRLNVERLIY